MTTPTKQPKRVTKAQLKNLTIEQILFAISEQLPKYDGQVFDSPLAASKYFRMRLAYEEREHFDIAYLNSQHQLIECVRLFSGTINCASVYPREVVKKALELNAAAVIFAHNHPSGNPEPSQSDITLTGNLSKALDLVQIKVLDHLVVAQDAIPSSFAERGLL